jgi:non-canonical purine NTP pyrophosphatase (RdgB/HAM1 family)
MTDLIFVTGSAGKFREAAAILEPFGIRLTQRDLKLPEPQLDDPRAVVRFKARQAFRRLRQPLLVDDTALTLAGYPCFPGAYTAAIPRTLGLVGLKRLLDPDHPATLTSHVCLHDGQRLRVFTGRWHGRMVPTEHFTGDWPYNEFFIPDGFDCPLSELPWEVRLQHSHRRRALNRLARFLTREENDAHR